jgi:hypothetical protein
MRGDSGTVGQRDSGTADSGTAEQRHSGTRPNTSGKITYVRQHIGGQRQKPITSYAHGNRQGVRGHIRDTLGHFISFHFTALLRSFPYSTHCMIENRRPLGRGRLTSHAVYLRQHRGYGSGEARGIRCQPLEKGKAAASTPGAHA